MGPPEFPRQLEQDSGFVYVAQNAACHPDSPLEPLFRSLYLTKPYFDIRLVDVVSDRNSILKLLAFAASELRDEQPPSFIIRVELARDTVMFCCEETATHRVIVPHECGGYGHNFEKLCTTSQISGSTGHYRIISYDFGKMDFIICHETDGYLDTEAGASSSVELGPAGEGLSKKMELLTISSAHSTTNTDEAKAKLVIKEEGKVVPLESTVEIRFRATTEELNLNDVMSQLWVSQTHNLILARHEGGMFQAPVVEDIGAEIQDWEENTREELVGLAAVIRKIVGVMREHRGTAVIKYDVTSRMLSIYRTERFRMLPDDLYSKWNDDDEPLDAGSSTDC